MVKMEAINEWPQNGHNALQSCVTLVRTLPIPAIIALLIPAIIAKDQDIIRLLTGFLQMVSSGIPGVNEHAAKYIQRALLPDQNEAEATAIFTR